MNKMKENLNPYTIEELNARIDRSEQQLAAGKYQDFDDAMLEIEEEFVGIEELEVAEAV